jgi:hypothetical protein
MTSLRAREAIERNKFPLLAAAAAIGAAGFLITVPAPAQAAPCSQWGFPTGGNGFTNQLGQSLLFQAAGKTVSQSPASWTGPNGTKGSGYLNGSINGSGMNFTWKGDGGPPDFKGGATITFVGNVNNDGSAGGTVSYSTGGPGSFTLTKPMTCLDVPAAAPPQQQGQPQQPEPQQQAKPMATVTGDVDLYDTPGGSGNVIGMLNSGQQVEFISCKSDNWCHVAPGWVWGDFLQKP